MFAYTRHSPPPTMVGIWIYAGLAALGAVAAYGTYGGIAAALEGLPVDGLALAGKQFGMLGGNIKSLTHDITSIVGGTTRGFMHAFSL